MPRRSSSRRRSTPSTGNSTPTSLPMRNCSSSPPAGRGGRVRATSMSVSAPPTASWTDAVSLGDRINSPGPEFCPLLSPDGKYLFFTSFRVEQGLVPETPFGRADFYKAHNLPGNGLGDIYWVDARVIEPLRPQGALPTEADARNVAGGHEQRIAVATYAASAEQDPGRPGRWRGASAGPGREACRQPDLRGCARSGGLPSRMAEATECRYPAAGDGPGVHGLPAGAEGLRRRPG